MKCLIATAFGLMFLSGTALADMVKIGGDNNQNANVDNMIQTIIGKGNTAEQLVSSIKGNANIGGDNNQNANVDNMIQTIIGKGNKATQSVSSISN